MSMRAVVRAAVPTTLLTITLALAVAISGCSVGNFGRSAQLDSLQTNLNQHFEAGGADAAVGAFYADRAYEPLWTDARGLTDQAEDLLELFAADENEARVIVTGTADVRADLQALIDRADEAETVAAWQDVELAMTDVFLAYSNAILHGQVDPKAVHAQIYLPEEPFPADSLLSWYARAGDAEAFFEELEPRSPIYDRLLEARMTYRDLAEQGGWPVIDGTGAIEPGMEGDRVRTLRQRLAATGDLDDDGSAVYDDAVAAAVARFQARHGLEVDSIAGEGTLAALNVPVEKRLEQIEMSLERWRWLPQTPGDRYVLVNIPSFTLTAYDGGEPELEIPVVVGATYSGRETPVLSDSLKQVVFRPYWNVPEGIALEEILPKERANPGYLASNGYEIVGPDGNVAASADLENFEGYRIRQKPGTGNALGYVKYPLMNPYAIYLHDTPSDHLFSRTERAYSHGCIRLGDPAAFGAYALEVDGWSKEEVQAAMQQEEQQAITLSQPIPVYVQYLTAYVDDEGTVHFRDDLYGFDAALAAHMDRGNSAIREALAAVRR